MSPTLSDRASVFTTDTCQIYAWSTFKQLSGKLFCHGACPTGDWASKTVGQQYCKFHWGGGGGGTHVFLVGMWHWENETDTYIYLIGPKIGPTYLPTIKICPDFENVLKNDDPFVRGTFPIPLVTWVPPPLGHREQQRTELGQRRTLSQTVHNWGRYGYIFRWESQLSTTLFEYLIATLWEKWSLTGCPNWFRLLLLCNLRATATLESLHVPRRYRLLGTKSLSGRRAATTLLLHSKGVRAIWCCFCWWLPTGWGVA